jgi:hypothetical protein
MQEVNGKFVYVDHSDSHNYKGCKTELPSGVKNPLDGQLVQKKLLVGLEKTDGASEDAENSKSEVFITNQQRKKINCVYLVI